MNKLEDSPAFPIVHPDGTGVQYFGMSLRDYFAAKVAGGICTHQDTWGLSDSEKIAKFSYELADAMLAERAK